MAYSRRSSARRSNRRPVRSRRSTARTVSRGKRGGGYSGRARSGSARQQTVRIVLEHPASNPMLTVPVGQKVDSAVPSRARF